MPNPILAITGGSALAGIFGANKAASAQKSAAGDAAAAQMYATDQQIQAQKDAVATATKAAVRGNRRALNATKRYGYTATGVDIGGEKAARDALLRANGSSAGAMTTATNDGTDALIAAAREGRVAKTGASRDAQRSIVLGNVKSAREARDTFGATEAAYSPYTTAGDHAISAIDKGLAGDRFSMDGWKFQADPGYAFRQAQGEKAIERSAAARGGLLSGGQLAAAADFNSGLASQEYGAAYARGAQQRADDFNRLTTVSGIGQAAHGSVEAARDAMTGRVADANLGIANARAAGAMDRGGYAADYADTRGNVLAAQADALGKIRAGQAATGGNIRADALTTIAGLRSGNLRTIGQTQAQGALNVANQASTGATQTGNVLVDAYGKQGQAQAQAALQSGAATADALGNINGAVQDGIGNYLMMSMLGRGGAKTPTIYPNGTNPFDGGAGNWLSTLFGKAA